ncbi:MAG: OsmC family protein [Verrucomicrobiaceae bacterium]|nr:OsmC family protein [Verrucomicrobiaceae bacterium]
MSNIKNGVNLTDIENLVNGIKENPGLANVQFQAKSTWGGSTKANVEIGPCIAGGQDISPPTRKFKMVVDEPGVLGGEDSAPNPVEYLAAALCGCLTAGIATNAGLFDVQLDKIEVEVAVNFDIHGVLGLNKQTPSGPLSLHYKVKLGGPGAAEAMERCKTTIDRKSPIKNAIHLPLQVTTDFELLP